MGERNLNILALQVNDRIQGFNRHIIREKVEQTILRGIFLTIIHKSETRIEVRIIAHHGLNKLIAEMIVLEQAFAIIWHKLYTCSAFFAARIVLHLGVRNEVSLSELSTTCFAIAETLNHKLPTECIDGLGTYTIQADGLFECFGIVFTTRVEQRYCFHHLAQWYATAIVAHTDNFTRIARLIGIRMHTDLYHLALIHAELIDRVINSLLDKHIDTVIVVLTIAQFTDIHTRTTANMLAVIQVDDIIVVVRTGWYDFFSHKSDHFFVRSGKLGDGIISS